MDSKIPADATSSTSRPVDPTSHDHHHNPPSYDEHADHKTHQPSRRPGEDLMKSGDPSTAALRAWAEDKQKQVPGSNGSFVTGPMSMGVGAVSGGPMFLPRKEYIVEPPMHEVDHLRAEELREAGKGPGEHKRRGSVRDFFKRMSKGKEEKEEGEESGEQGDAVR